MLRIILGIFLIIISLFLGLIFIIGIPNNIELIIVAFSSKVNYSLGYATGNLIFSIFILLFSIWSFKTAIKLLKSKNIEIESINEIGKN